MQKYLKSKWVWVMVIAAAALASGDVFSGGQFHQILLVLLGQ